MRFGGMEGSIVVVTGAAGGIGRALTNALLDEGARVLAIDRDEAELDRAAASLSPRFPECIRTAPLDVRNSRAVEQAIDVVERDWGPIEAGVNVAGVLSTTLVCETSDEAWKDVFDVNAGGVFHVSRSLAARMIPRRRGAIVTVSSNAAGVPRHGMAAYAASKSAATMFTLCLGLELAEFGIRCNVVSPGSTRTPMQEAMWARGTGPEAVISGSLEKFRTGIPLGKLAEPRDVVHAVLFLLSDLASHITMADLYVDGGGTLRA